MWFSLDGDTWRQKFSIPMWTARLYHDAVVFQDKIWVLGGYRTYVDETGFHMEYCNDVWSFGGSLGCEGVCGPANDPPTVRLVADPPTGEAPLEVVLQSFAEDPNCDPLTYAWAFNDGTVEDPGTQNTEHTFAANGTYTVTVTVSDGEFIVTDTATVTVGGTLPKQTGNIGPEGGNVELGQCRVEIAPGFNPVSAPFTLTELPDMAESAAHHLDPARFTPFGPAYNLDTPVKAGTPFTIALSYDALPPGAKASSLGVMMRAVTYPVTPSNLKTPPGRPPVVIYSIFPATVARKTQSAHFDAFGGCTFQLVALAEPLDFTEHLVDIGDKAGSQFTVKVFIEDTAGDEDRYRAAVVEGCTQSAQTLVGARGFPLPALTLYVFVGDASKYNALGYVHMLDPTAIYLEGTMTDSDQIKKVVAHEFFHCIQAATTNKASIHYYLKENFWFWEGTSDWACDEVYDNIVGQYHAPAWDRFMKPLNQESTDGSTEYQTCGFWKWVEAKRSNTIQAALLLHDAATHSTYRPMPMWRYQNTTLQKYTQSFLAAYPDVDFTQFIQDICYWKNFDKGETNPGELWDAARMGPQGETYVRDTNYVELKAGEPGDDESNKRTVQYLLTQYLSSDLFVFENADLNGKLHIKLQQTASGLTFDMGIVVVDEDGNEVMKQTVRDLSATHEEIKVQFNPGHKAYLFFTDPRWLVDWFDLANPGFFEIWVENPCGDIAGSSVDVSTTDELVAALHSITPGNTIYLAAGTYNPPPSDWTIGDWPGWHSPNLAQVGLDGIVLAGEGPGKTTLVLSNKDVWYPILVGGNTVIRDMSIVCPGEEYCIEASGHLKVCNVDIYIYRAPPWSPYAIDFVPQAAGSYSLEVDGCWIRSGYDTNPVSIGINLYGGVYPGTSITATIRDTVISHFCSGIEWDNVDPVTTDVTIEGCDLISGREYNAVEWTYDYFDPETGHVIAKLVEHCPR